MAEYQNKNRLYINGFVWIMIAVVLMTMLDQVSAGCDADDSNCTVVDTSPSGGDSYYNYFRPRNGRKGVGCPPIRYNGVRYTDCVDLCYARASDSSACSACCLLCCNPRD